METVERYIYAVTRRLPEKARADVELELRGLIEDLLEERLQGKKASKDDVNEVLMELGNPEDLAKEYGGKPQYLIGPRLFDSYLKVLKLVGSIVLALVELVVVIKAFMAPMGIVAFIIEFLGTLFEAGIQVFVWVTLVFAGVEYFGQDDLGGSAKEWTPALLPEIPDQKRQIPMSEPLVGIGLSILFLVMYIMPQRFSVIQVAGSSTTVIPIVNQEMIPRFLPLFIAFAGVTIFKEVWKLAKRVWSGEVAVVNLICNGIAIVLAYLLFANPEFWNPGFIEQVLEANVSSATGILQTLWPLVTTRFIYVIVIAYVIDALSALYRGFSIHDKGARRKLHD